MPDEAIRSSGGEEEHQEEEIVIPPSSRYRIPMAMTADEHYARREQYRVRIVEAAEARVCETLESGLRKQQQQQQTNKFMMLRLPASRLWIDMVFWFRFLVFSNSVLFCPLLLWSFLSFF